MAVARGGIGSLRAPCGAVVDVIISRFIARHGLKLSVESESSRGQCSSIHELVTPEDEQELVHRRRPDQHLFLLSS
eukprot:3799085-Prymnesium_polylepis.1